MRSVFAAAILVAMLPVAAFAQTPGVMSIPQQHGTVQCDAASTLPGTVAGRLGGDFAATGRARLLIVPESDASEYFYGALAAATHGATPTARLPFDTNDLASVERYETQLRDLRAQMRFVTIASNGSFRCGGLAPGRYLLVIQILEDGVPSFYKAYATIPAPRTPGEQFTVNPTQPQPFN
jgi:hypothetical protein